MQHGWNQILFLAPATCAMPVCFSHAACRMSCKIISVSERHCHCCVALPLYWICSIIFILLLLAESCRARGSQSREWLLTTELHFTNIQTVRKSNLTVSKLQIKIVPRQKQQMQTRLAENGDGASGTRGKMEKSRSQSVAMMVITVTTIIIFQHIYLFYYEIFEWKYKFIYRIPRVLRLWARLTVSHMHFSLNER